MLESAHRSSNSDREDFFQGLYEEVNEDYQTLRVETDTLSHRIYVRESTERGKSDFTFGVPLCDCAGCRKTETSQRKEMERQAATTSDEESEKSGVPNCWCKKCKRRRRERHQHKKLKRKARVESQEDFELAGCLAVIALPALSLIPRLR